MSRYVIDILSPAANADYFPQDPNIILIVPDTFVPSREIASRFAPCYNIDQALCGGSYYFKVPNEFERGLLIGVVLGRWPEAKLLTSRLDIYRKISPRFNLQQYKENSQVYYNESYASTEASSVCPNSPREELKSPYSPQRVVAAQPLSAQDRYLDNIYYEVLNKYYERFLIQAETRATKIKSARSQLKNLSDGVLMSVKKKALSEVIDALPSSEEVSSMVYEDLLGHRIIEESGMSVHYNDSLINEYLGREKIREFKPRYKEARNQIPPSRNQRPPSPPPPPPPQPRIMAPDAPVYDRQKILDTAYMSIWKLLSIDISEGNPQDIGDLVSIISDRFDKNQMEEPEKYPISIKDEIIKREIKMLFIYDQIALQSNSEKSAEFIAENYKTNRREKISSYQFQIKK